MFQYISCYSLSMVSSKSHILQPCFNTSHVTLYLEVKDVASVYMSFNTSHVTLYRLDRQRCMALSTFQYISCYSLSNPS